METVYDHSIAKWCKLQCGIVSSDSPTTAKQGHYFLRHWAFKFPMLGNMIWIISGLIVTEKKIVVIITFLLPTWAPEQVSRELQRLKRQSNNFDLV